MSNVLRENATAASDHTRTKLRPSYRKSQVLLRLEIPVLSRACIGGQEPVGVCAEDGVRGKSRCVTKPGESLADDFW